MSNEPTTPTCESCGGAHETRVTPFGCIQARMRVVEKRLDALECKAVAPEPAKPRHGPKPEPARKPDPRR